MKQLVVFPRGQLSRTDKDRMTKAGIVAVEADDPGSVRMVLPSSALVTADDLLLSAMDGLTSNDFDDKPGAAMVRSLVKRLRDRATKESE